MYAWMSFLNLLGSLICPQYPSCYLVESKTSDELKDRLRNRSDLFLFESSIGRIDERTENLLEVSKPEFLNYLLRDAYHWDRARTWKWEESAHSNTTVLQRLQRGLPFAAMQSLTLICSVIVPIAIIGAMSHFAPNSSTLYQRVWTMAWLAMSYTGFSFILGIRWGAQRLRNIDSAGKDNHPLQWENIIAISFTCIYYVPAIGGFVVVSQMILSYGVCEKI
ncbi:hypothetical protein BJ166DRAFT_246573 [Pestalotiopsis sp. NC0098]|nr:hypothetical protein BJ166DRAFT_246573 [Pestalotiopsis sp. NC0098]